MVKRGAFTPQPLAGAASTVDLGFCGSDTTTTSLTVRFSNRAADWVEWAATRECGADYPWLWCTEWYGCSPEPPCAGLSEYHYVLCCTILDYCESWRWATWTCC